MSLALPRLSPCSVPVLHTASSRDGRPAPSSRPDRNLSPQQPSESARPSGLPGKLPSHLAACGGSLCTQEGPQLCPGRQHPPPAPWLLVEAAGPPARHPANAAGPAGRWGQETCAPPRASSPRKGPLLSSPALLPSWGWEQRGRRDESDRSPPQEGGILQPRAPRAASGPSDDLSDNWLTALPSRSLTRGAMTSLRPAARAAPPLRKSGFRRGARPRPLLAKTRNLKVAGGKPGRPRPFHPSLTQTVERQGGPQPKNGETERGELTRRARVRPGVQRSPRPRGSAGCAPDGGLRPLCSGLLG